MQILNYLGEKYWFHVKVTLIHSELESSLLSYSKFLCYFGTLVNFAHRYENQGRVYTLSHYGNAVLTLDV